MLAGIEHRLAQDASRCLAFLEPGGDHDRGLGAAPGEIGDDAGHRLGGRADHGKIRDQGQARDIWIGEHALDGAVLRIDRHDRPVEAAAEQVAGHQRADRAGLLARADQGDRLGLEQELQITDRHRCSAPSGMRCLVQPASSTLMPWMAMPARVAFQKAESSREMAVTDGHGCHDLSGAIARRHDRPPVTALSDWAVRRAHALIRTGFLGTRGKVEGSVQAPPRLNPDRRRSCQLGR